jgi:energy-coupling factor transporter ATP-binding protein EcfA2
MALLELERISAQYPGASTPVLADINLSLGPRHCWWPSGRPAAARPRCST